MSVRIDCDTCEVRGLACHDCVVTVLLGPPPEMAFDDEECRARVNEYEAATLILDLVDVRTNRIVWRGWARHSLEGVLDNPDRMAQRIDQAVTGMMQKFPRPL